MLATLTLRYEEHVEMVIHAVWISRFFVGSRSVSECGAFTRQKDLSPIKADWGGGVPGL